LETNPLNREINLIPEINHENPHHQRNPGFELILEINPRNPGFELILEINPRNPS